MRFSGKRTLLVAVALTTFFAAAHTYSKGKNKWGERMVTDTPAKKNTETEGITAVAEPEEKKLACRTAALSLGTYFSQPTKWAYGQSQVAVPYLKSGIGSQVNCTSAVPPLLTDADLPVSQGVINIYCADGALRVTSSDCWGKTKAIVEEENRIAAEKAAAEAAAAAAAAEAKRIADEKAAADAAAAAAAQAAADAAAAAAAANPVAACSSNCSADTSSYSYRVCAGKNGGGTYQIIYRNCLNGQKYITSSSSTNATYGAGQCVGSLPGSC